MLVDHVALEMAGVVGLVGAQRAALGRRLATLQAQVLLDPLDRLVAPEALGAVAQLWKVQWCLERMENEVLAYSRSQQG